MTKFFKKILKETTPLERQFAKEVRLRKEVNSEAVWSAYYIPLAAQQIIREQGDLTKDDTFKMQCLANAMMFQDLADGKLTELYRFKESEV